MFLKLLVISIFLVAIAMLALGVKMIFNPRATFTVHSCAFENVGMDEDMGCSKCGLKELADCPEKNNVNMT